MDNVANSIFVRIGVINLAIIFMAHKAIAYYSAHCDTCHAHMEAQSINIYYAHTQAQV